MKGGGEVLDIPIEGKARTGQASLTFPCSAFSFREYVYIKKGNLFAF
jgi:hypothetical protein